MYYFIFLILTCSRMFFHPLHFSITNIDINSKLHVAEISYQFFADDFKNMLQNHAQTVIDLDQNKDLTPQNIEAVNDYIFSAFEVKFNKSEKINLDFQYKKRDEALIRLYYKGELPMGEIESITLVNELMLDLYEDQTNLVIISLDGEEKGYTFNYRKKTLNIEY
jgi:hypothetical protein